MAQRNFDLMNPRVLPAPNDRAAWLSHFLPAHPWVSNPEGRKNLIANKELALREREVDVLLAEFAARERERFFHTAVPTQFYGAGWDGWLHFVFDVEVDIRLGGRAVLTHPRFPFAVAFRFTPTGRRVRREAEVMLQEVRITSNIHPPHLVIESVDLSGYYAAFQLHMERITQQPRARFYDVAIEPTPGRPAARGYYALLLAEYDELRAAGHHAPAKELAERRGVNRNTLRTHLRKARLLADR